MKYKIIYEREPSGREWWSGWDESGNYIQGTSTLAGEEECERRIKNLVPPIKRVVKEIEIDRP